MPNHNKLTSNWSNSGSKIGTIINTIGTHSNGQPRRKINAITIIKITVLDNSNSKSTSVSIVGVPSHAKTAPKKLDAATNSKINTDISNVLIMESFKFSHVKRRYASASKIAPSAPQPAPSVGVAKPKRMLPNAANTKNAGGTNPRKNSRHTSAMLAARSSSGIAGPKDGLIKHRPTA